jgi:hypothetical protein
MNWPRVWSGALFAALVIIVGECGAVAISASGPFRWMDLWAYKILLLAAPAVGFVLSYFYALARPRLGPGPRTALWIGTLIAIVWVAALYPILAGLLFTQWIQSLPLLAIKWIECLAAAYVAGWQYIERAP